VHAPKHGLVAHRLPSPCPTGHPPGTAIARLLGSFPSVVFTLHHSASSVHHEAPDDRHGERCRAGSLLDAAALYSHLLGEGWVHAFLAEHRRRLFPDEMLADLFPSGRGRPSVPADVIATVMVLQALEGHSDREACRAPKTDIEWKAAAGLALTDEAFHPTVLTLWRIKLRASDDPDGIFDAVRAVIAETDVAAGKHRRVLDSTLLDDAMTGQDTVTMLATEIRRVRKLVLELQRVWLRGHNLAPGRPPCDWDDPAGVERLVSELVDDANELVSAAEALDSDQAQADAVALLALVAGQDVEPGDGPGRRRIAQRTAPDRVISTVDPETRHVHKSQRSSRTGYMAHVAVEPDTGLATDCELTAGSTGDAEAAPGLLDSEAGGTEKAVAEMSAARLWGGEAA
jgi:Transposase domain (DUF772)